MPVLDARLEAALALIRGPVHADIGSDHARLPIELVRRGHVQGAVIVELNAGPLDNARRAVALAGLTGRIEVRAGNGLAPLRPGEVSSASLTGLGAATILGILRRAGAGTPDAVVTQPNDSPGALRTWAREAGFHVRAERLAPGFWTYPVLRFERHPGPDPAYDGLPLAAALRYGPLLLRGGGALLRQQVCADVTLLTPLAAPGRPAEAELRTARAALAWLDGDALGEGGENKKPVLLGR